MVRALRLRGPYDDLSLPRREVGETSGSVALPPDPLCLTTPTAWPGQRRRARRARSPRPVEPRRRDRDAPETWGIPRKTASSPAARSRADRRPGGSRRRRCVDGVPLRIGRAGTHPVTEQEVARAGTELASDCPGRQRRTRKRPPREAYGLCQTVVLPNPASPDRSASTAQAAVGASRRRDSGSRRP